MLRRAILLAVLFVVLGVSPGVTGERSLTRATDLAFVIDIDSSQFSDTATSAVFGVGGWTYSEIVGKIFSTGKDSIFAKDSVSFSLEAKVDDSYDSTWYTIWTAGPIEDGTTKGVQTTVSVQMADSSASVWDLFRWNLIFHCNDDSTGDHGVTFDWNGTYRAHVIFRLR